MAAYLLEWLHLIFRWLHLVAGAAWIGASFYFNWLNNNVRPPEDGRKDVAGEVWSVHGGAFYQAIKHGYTLERLPRSLHWFYWEAYTTWLSGIGLLTVVYWLNASAWMAGTLSAPAAVGVGVGTLVVGWVVYDLLCKSPLAKRPGLFGLVIYALVVATCWGLGQVLPARAAFIHTGAMVGTIMAANVYFVIIPSQRVMVDAASKGQPPDPGPGKEGAMRSLHNNYFTLPVLFVMVSNHFAFTYGHPHAWLVFAAVSAVGVAIRHGFNRKGQGLPYAGWMVGSALAGLGIIGAMAPPPPKPSTVPFAEVAPILKSRCQPCHATQPTWPGFPSPPAGLVLTDEAHAEAVVAKIKTQVEGRIMPLGNLTGLTDEERTKLVEWATR